MTFTPLSAKNMVRSQYTNYAHYPKQLQKYGEASMSSFINPSYNTLKLFLP